MLGGLAEPDEWDLNIGLHNYEPVRADVPALRAIHAGLRYAEIDAAEPVRVGLRPVREQDVRVEAEPRTRIVHNYGHGGSGVTFSWGCAEVADLVERVVAGSRGRHSRERPALEAEVLGDFDSYERAVRRPLTPALGARDDWGSAGPAREGRRLDVEPLRSPGGSR